MSKLLSQTMRSVRRLWHVLAAFLLVVSGTANARDSNVYVVVDDVTIYYAFAPAEMLQSFPSGSQETRMHGGVPDGKHVHRVQVALFHATTENRITDANVIASIAELGLGVSDYTLEPFKVGDALTHGGIAEFQKNVALQHIGAGHAARRWAGDFQDL